MLLRTFALFSALLAATAASAAQSTVTISGPAATITGPAALGDWHGDAPGVRRLIKPADLLAVPVPSAATASAAPGPTVPVGFTVQKFASGLMNPRVVRVAPGGDIFVAESGAGQIRVMRARDGEAKPDVTEIYAAGLEQPFGMAFYPAGDHPQWLYVATLNALLRFPYTSGDLKARAAPETVVAKFAGSVSGHVTRDIAFSKDGRTAFVSVGSSTNAGEGVAVKTAADARAWNSTHNLGAYWDEEEDRGGVLAFDVATGKRKAFATGLRNCVGLAVHPRTGDLWCSVSERDSEADERIADYVARVREGAFFGWPWYYIGRNEDLRFKGARPELAAKVSLPDVLFPPKSVPLQITFYQAPAKAAARFPADYSGDAFVSFHGSLNNGVRTSSKVVRVRLKNGAATGEYEDFLTGFVINDAQVSGRPVGVAVAHDGALLVTEDARGTMWRVAYAGGK